MCSGASDSLANYFIALDKQKASGKSSVILGKTSVFWNVTQFEE